MSDDDGHTINLGPSESPRPADDAVLRLRVATSILAPSPLPADLRGDVELVLDELDRLDALRTTAVELLAS